MFSNLNDALLQQSLLISHVCCVIHVLCIINHFKLILWLDYLNNCVKEFSGGFLERFGSVKCFSFPQEGGGSPFTAEPSGNTSVTTSGLAPPTDCECPVPVKVGRARWATGGERWSENHFYSCLSKMLCVCALQWPVSLAGLWCHDCHDGGHSPWALSRPGPGGQSQAQGNHFAVG